MIAKFGLSLLDNKELRLLISFKKLYPRYEGKKVGKLTIDACFLWEQEKASLTNASKFLLIFLAKSRSFFSSDE